MALAHPDDRLKPLTVSQVARRSGVAISAVHFYEAKGLILSLIHISEPTRPY